MHGAKRAAIVGAFTDACTLAFSPACTLAFALSLTTSLTASLAVAQDPPRNTVVQQSPIRPKARDVARGGVLTSALDSWLVTRFRSAQLIDDTAGVSTAVEESVQYPRVESAREAPAGDTLFALHFGAGSQMQALRSPSVVRLSGPSGSITSHTARIVVRRAFRAPKVPSAKAADKHAWRYGWAYMAVIKRGVRPSPSLGYRGWLLIEMPDTVPRDSTTRRRDE